MSDKSLLIKRTPHAFAFFLAHMKSRACAYTKVRLHVKTTVWRMDLLSLRYRGLHDSEKQIFIAKSEEALARKSVVRLQKLHDLRDAVVGPSQSSAVADAAVGSAQSSAVAEVAIDVASVAKGTKADAGGGTQFWLIIACYARAIACIRNLAPRRSRFGFVVCRCLAVAACLAIG